MIGMVLSVWLVDVQGARFVFPFILDRVRAWMSRAAKITLAVSAVACVGTVWGVHYMQRRERAVRGFFGIFFFARAGGQD
jgi:hypothetical protein